MVLMRPVEFSVPGLSSLHMARHEAAPYRSVSGSRFARVRARQNEDQDRNGIGTSYTYPSGKSEE